MYISVHRTSINNYVLYDIKHVQQWALNKIIISNNAQCTLLHHHRACIFYTDLYCISRLPCSSNPRYTVHTTAQCNVPCSAPLPTVPATPPRPCYVYSVRLSRARGVVYTPAMSVGIDLMPVQYRLVPSRARHKRAPILDIPRAPQTRTQ